MNESCQWYTEFFEQNLSFSISLIDSFNQSWLVWESTDLSNI